MANQWFRMYSEFAIDPKVQRLSEADQRRYIMLLCLRCCNGDVTLHDDDVAFQLRISNEDWLTTKSVLIGRNLIDDKCNLTNKIDINEDRPPSHIWRDIRNRIFKRDDYTCQYCGKRGLKLECDHVIPVAKGGSHNDENLVTACFECNRSKKDKLVHEWRGE